MAFTGIQFSKLCYTPNSEVIRKTTENTDFKIKDIIHLHNTTMIVAQYTGNTDFTVIAFSGTDNYSKQNIVTNWGLRLKQHDQGRVHAGWLALFNQFRSAIQHAATAENILWTGHSRGAVIAALAQAAVGKGVLYSYGCPRFADGDWITANTLPHWRFVLRGDPITRLPPRFLGFRHHGVRIVVPENTQSFDITDGFVLGELSKDWQLISYTVRDWLRGRQPGRHHRSMTYQNCFAHIADSAVNPANE